ncbi:MAG TPA: hypothetical protein VN240_03680, partial [Propylenella sp.]|nr:hypothetical protein [Propylenella sp.]
IPAERRAYLVAEDLFAQPEQRLASLCTALGLPADEAAVAAMMHPETSPFARIGPAGASLGDDPDFLRDPHFRAPPTGEGTQPPSSPVPEKAA